VSGGKSIFNLSEFSVFSETSGIYGLALHKTYFEMRGIHHWAILEAQVQEIDWLELRRVGYLNALR
jgi:hypothetical protein